MGTLLRAACFAGASVAGAVLSDVGQSLPFSVSVGGAEDVEVSSTSGVRCTMSFSTVEGALSSGGAGGLSEEDLDKAAVLLSSLAGTYTKKFGDWEYAVKLGRGGEVTQRAGEQVFSLGRGDARRADASGRPNRVAFVGGDLCGDKPRSTDVTLHCGDRQTLVEGREPSTCAYTFAVTDPALCDVEAAFPRHPSEGAAGGGEGGGSASPGAGLSLDVLLPPVARQRVLRSGAGESLVSLLKEGLEVAGRAGAGSPGEGEDARRAAAGAGGQAGQGGGISSKDVAGVGGASLGIDDSARHGVVWSGLTSGQRDDRSAWTLALHPTWEAGGGEGGPGRGTWTCSAWSIDDLRRGTEGPAGGGVPLQSASLTLRLAEEGVPYVLTAVARNARRQALPVQVQYQAQEDGTTVVRVTVEEGEAGEGEAPSTAVQELAYLSLTLQQSGGAA